MTFNAIGGLAVSALLIAVPLSSASAADMPLKAPPPPPAPVYSWTGFYIGGNAGGAWERQSNSLSVDNQVLLPGGGFFAGAVVAGVNASGTQNLNSAGFTGGGQIGYNYQSGNVVWGVELDFESLRQNANAGGGFSYITAGTYTLNLNASTNWLFTARPRVGWAIDRSLLYVTGGVAATKRNVTQSFFDPGAGGFAETATFSKVQAGWTVGAGYEYALVNNWTIKGEYLFAGFGGGTASGLVGNGIFGTAVLNNSVSNLKIQILRAGLNYKFGG
jgi:outer membrane immunogenic protein